MKKELVKYHNDLNKISTRGWTAIEMNIFFSIINQVNDKGSNQVSISMQELRKLSEKTNTRHKARWLESLKTSLIKIGSLVYFSDTDDGFEVMTLFSFLKLSNDQDKLIAKVSENYAYIVNQLTREFTVWELEEFTSLDSSYSKSIYRLLKQWKYVGVVRFKADEFRLKLDIPDSYNAGMIKKRVIDKALSELKDKFENLNCDIIKSDKQGTPVIEYIFTFDPEQKQAKPPAHSPTRYKKAKKQEPIPFWLKEGAGSDQKTIENTGDQEQLKERMKQVFDNKEN